jgi:hypothetical protein
MKRVLFVGENPLGTSGNSNMLAAMLSDLDTEKYQAACFVVHDVNPSSVLFDPLPFTLVNGTSATDYWGNHRLISLIQESEFDFLCMVGVDFWRYLPAWKALKQLRKAKKFKWIGIFPYDLWQVNPQWASYWNDLDFPCVYSQYHLPLVSCPMLARTNAELVAVLPVLVRLPFDCVAYEPVCSGFITA